MNMLKSIIKHISFIRHILRLKIAIGYFTEPLKQLFIWLYRSKETTNFTYDLVPINKFYLASLIADLTGKQYQEIEGYFEELEKDDELKHHIRQATQDSEERFEADLAVRFGRRLGWYAFVRAIKPKIVVETGVDKGLGSCVLTAALIKNENEGCPGYYYGTDINPKAGYLLGGKYKQYGEILYGDSITSLEKLEQQVDLFINDSDHSSIYEAREYATIAPKLNAQAIILGDNSHCTDELLKFALATGRHFIFFQEKPDKHWYPGAGIGIAFRRITSNNLITQDVNILK
jgi:hypothetical protein